jgi:hypothetical protein
LYQPAIIAINHVFALIATSTRFPIIAITHRFAIIATRFPIIAIAHRFEIIATRFIIIATHILVQISTFHSLYPSVREKMCIGQLCQVSTNICHTST